MEVEWTLGYALSEVHFLDEIPTIEEVEELIGSDSESEFLSALKSNDLAQVIDDHIVEVVEELIERINEPDEGSVSSDRIPEEAITVIASDISDELEKYEEISGMVSEANHDNKDKDALEAEHQELHAEHIAENLSETGQQDVHSEDSARHGVYEIQQEYSSNTVMEPIQDFNGQEPIEGSIQTNAEAQSMKAFARRVRQVLLAPLLAILSFVRSILNSILGIVVRYP